MLCENFYFFFFYTNQLHRKLEFIANFKKRMKAKLIDFYLCRIADPSQRENLGIIVQYKVKVKLLIGGPILGG